MSADSILSQQELEPAFVAELLEMSEPLPKERRLPASRLLLLQCYDAAHTRAGGQYQPCALQKARPAPKPGQMWTRPLRMAAAIDLFRKLTGDVSAASEALSTEAEAIAKRRDAVGAHTPSLATRTWFGEPPTATTARAGGGSFASSRRPASASAHDWPCRAASISRNRTATGAQAPTAIAALSILPLLITSRAAVMAIEITRYRRAPSFSNPAQPVSACSGT